MTLLRCIAILAPISFLLKCWLAALGIVNIRTSLEVSHFTMLTPRENLDVDSEDSEPAPHRNSGFRVVAEDGLQLSQFLTRISNKRSSEIRVYSFQSRKPLPMTTKMGDLPLKMSIQIWSEDLAKAIEDGLKSCMWRAPTRTMPRITKSSSSGIFLHGNFSTVVRQTALNKIVEFNSSPTRWTVFALDGELGAGPRHSMRELPHSHLPELFGQELDRPLGAVGDWRHLFLWLCLEMRLPCTAVTSGGWSLGRRDSQLCHAQETTAFRIFIYNFMSARK